jgi:hypothetical protein
MAPIRQLLRDGLDLGPGVTFLVGSRDPALHEMSHETGAQLLCATHSPLLASLPGATILQLDQDGYRPVTWPDLELVTHWRNYLAEPQRYLRHVLTSD